MLFLSPLWPEDTSSAAGVRTSALVRAFSDWGYRVSYAAWAAPTESRETLRRQGVAIHEVKPNRSADMEAAVSASRPDVVVFDRFFAEEAHSFLVRDLAPEAVRVLDMQDLHALRRWRQRAVETRGAEASLSVPDATSQDDLLRELAAVHRCDLTLVCSPVELGLLRDAYGVPSEKLRLAPFFADAAEPPRKSFAERLEFVTIGGFKHAPNVDGARWLKRDVWPKIRARLPDATVRLWGASASDHLIDELHAPEDGFLVSGFARDLRVLGDARVLLAPLRFGAGIKGKIVDAWRYATPVAATPVAAEGMMGKDPTTWGGLVASTPDADAFAEAAVRLHECERTWTTTRDTARRLLAELYDRDVNLRHVHDAVADARAHLRKRRARDYFAATLWHQTARSTEYFSRWIELKESIAESAHR